ncbi:hypothetical protein BR63_00505 [Thermanaerosceptrum fracticalcis]|uniref:Uncharacterized protein n=1 Tax=Thermanaerosceptrum fracticalcis TaxID=1712410 RepID=A0A7G6E823_THEFR|nr:hypothetical protein BR63_00505 [Thermanaerosceptrum fracticalcis]
MIQSIDKCPSGAAAMTEPK